MIGSRTTSVVRARRLRPSPGSFLDRACQVVEIVAPALVAIALAGYAAHGIAHAALDLIAPPPAPCVLGGRP